ncbi:hypothetical protein [Catellatospora vulcania]|uniref:hypothetical protein n=1 Tax=Catellatospora vulcania TaxID=1460450 RepID=UPI0012D3BE42|nr:hypothetical protein [Catellatospora vulcania]
MSTPIEPPEPRKVRWGAIGAFVVGVVTVIGTLTQTWTLIFPASSATPETAATTAAGGAAPAATAPTTGPGVASAPAATPGALPPSGTYLRSLTPVRGAGLVVALPKALADLPEYAQAIAVRCPSNNTGQTMAEVSWERLRSADTFTARLLAYDEQANPTQIVELTVFPDPKDWLPGGDAQGPSRSVQAEIGAKPAAIKADVTGAYYVRLRIRCNKPGTVAVLVDPVLSP